MVTRRALLAAGVATPVTAAEGDAALAALLGRYVVAGADGVNRVRYGAWKAAPGDLAALGGWIDAAAARRPSTLPRAEAFAHWANLYNALTLRVVLDRYPVASIRDIRSTGVPFDLKGLIGPWRTRLVTVEGRRMSLDDIEHETLRPQFRDPRVHYAVNCASIGCPDLRAEPWRAEGLDQALDRAAAAYVNHPRGVAVVALGRIRTSSIYRWFREDFGDSEAGVLAHLARHAAPALGARLAGAEIAGHDYDWALNDAPG